MSHTAHPSVGLAPTGSTPECPGSACSDVAPAWPSSVPTAWFSNLYLYNFHRDQPIHRIACCDVATPSGSARFTFKTAPNLYFYNCCKSLYTGNTSHPVSEAASMAQRDCLLRCGSDVSGVIHSCRNRTIHGYTRPPPEITAPHRPLSSGKQEVTPGLRDSAARPVPKSTERRARRHH